ncbi:MAG: DnaJ domain-containing protein, partial [Trebonia sp.]
MSAKDYQKDYYKTLGVPKTATAAEIKKAYREL